MNGTLSMALAALLQVSTNASAATPAVDNPLLDSGPDPWITRDGDVFYYMGTHGDRLAIRATRDLAHLADAREVTVWRPPATGANAKSIWAPELHRIDGRWYIYYTAAAGDAPEGQEDAHRGVFVLENSNADPTRGTWTDRGRLATAHPGIDGTTFVTGGKRYFVYSPYVGPDSVLAIVAMANPWTLRGSETIIARPDQAWERQGGRQILEGPEFLQGPRGDLFLTYSGSACWSDDYAIGLLHAKAGADPLDASAWHKVKQPILAKHPAGNVYAPGHNGFFQMADGAPWIIYHANPGPDMGCTAKRSPRIQPVHWSQDGMPLLDAPYGRGVGVK
ncbi:glycoside hydrolase family 43 protein [Stenotrophomonas maltophilia]|jgi:GH43 family beta-xylosidase